MARYLAAWGRADGGGCEGRSERHEGPRRAGGVRVGLAALLVLVAGGCRSSEPVSAPSHAPGAAVAPAPAEPGEAAAVAAAPGAGTVAGAPGESPTGQPGEARPAEVQANEVQPVEGQPSEAPPSDAPPPSDGQPTDTPPSEAQAGDAAAHPTEAVDPDRRLLSAYREIYCHQKLNDQRGVIAVWQQYGYTPETWATEAQAAARRAAADPKGFGAQWARISADPCP